MVLLLNFPAPTEGVQLQQNSTSVDIDGRNLGNGTLFITESYVAWQKEEDGKGFSLQYPSISCHAISRDVANFPQECLYLMIDGKLPGEESASEDEDGDSDDDSDAGLTEVRFIPSDKTMLEPMYATMSDCQALHPDPEDVDSEDEMYDEEEEEYTENGVDASGSAPSSSTGETQEQLSHFGDVLHLGQGDGPEPSGATQPVMSASGDAGEEDDEEAMEVGQFQDADAME